VASFGLDKESSRLGGSVRAAAPAGSFLDWWCRLLEPYEASEIDAARFRVRQIQTVLRLTPFATVINVVNAAVLVAALRDQNSLQVLYTWLAAVSMASVLGLGGWFRSQRRPRATASRRAIRRTALHALVLGLLWGALPLLFFPRADSTGQFLIGMVITGMMCAGAFSLASVPFAGTLWTLATGVPAGVALALSDLNIRYGLLAMLVAYMAITIFGVWNSARTLGGQLVAEARADHQHEVIGLLLRDFEDQASDLLWEIDEHGQFAHASHRLLEQFQVSDAELTSLSAVELIDSRIPDTDEARDSWRRVQRHLANGTAFRDLMLAVRSAHGVHWWSLSARPLLNTEGHTIGWRGVASDHTDRHVAHSRLAWLAHNDALTGLVNRTQFRDSLQAMLADGVLTPFAVVYIDLDSFKQINDQLGHTAGDVLLQTFGKRLLAGARRNDTVARLGGDEFALLLREVEGEADVQSVLSRVLDLLAHPCELPERQVPLRASFGVALAPRDGRDIDTLMNRADLALYTAKHQGGGTYCFYHPALSEQGRRRALLEQALRGALDRRELRLEYQPQIDANNWRLSGFEALLRWRHPEHGDISPTEFVPIAESIGLMPTLGQWVLAEASREAANWPAHLSISVNVSALQLRDERFLARVLEATSVIEAARVELEVTESALLDDITGAVAMLHQLRAHGFRVALDDFGTGYSALSYLRRFPFDVLKIDRSFVRDLTSDQEALVIVDTILAMSRALNMITVAEGVESAEEAEMLRARGCTVLQGFLVSAPMPASAVLSFARSWSPRDIAGLRLLATG